MFIEQKIMLLMSEFLFTQPFTKVKHLVDSGIYAENTARDYLNKLCDMQVMEKKEIQGHHYYLLLSTSVRIKNPPSSRIFGTMAGEKSYFAKAM